MKSMTGILSAFMAGASFSLGLTLIYIQLAAHKDSADGRHSSKLTTDDVRKIVMEEMSPKIIEENLRRLASKPHIAGREVDEVELVNFISSSWNDSGLDVEIYPYDVLLSYPDDTDSNYVAIKGSDGKESFISSFEEKILDQSQNVSGVVNPYNAYSPPGDPEGELIYVNFASIEDFMQLNTTLGIDPRGKICIARYGRIFRGSKVTHAATFGCAGLILYSDPKGYTVKGKGVYPDDWYLPGTGAQRGSVLPTAGDPMTMNYPSIETAWRADYSDIPIPSIPVTPIGYDDASQYLSKMTGPPAPAKWQGGLNITYKLGPGFIGEFNTSKMRMHVTNKLETKRTHNVVGYIKGAVEPDRYVILGNHRDAWAFGALDPSSGTAVMLELARVLGLAVKSGWRPRRTLVFCSWGAEEFGLIGSTEWVEEFQKILQYRTVAYLNVDSSVVGIYSLYASASPIMRQLLFDAAKVIPNPNKAEAAAGYQSIYDIWRIKIPANQSDSNTMPRVLLPSSGSDFAAFHHFVGISFIDFAYIWDVRLGLDFYPVYHSVYETIDLMTTFLDPEFVHHQAVGRLWGELGLRLSESTIVPLNCIDYVLQIRTSMQRTLGRIGELLESHGIDTGLFIKAVDDLMKAAVDFHDRLENIDLNDTLAVRAANDQLVQLERAFIDIHGIDGRDQARHVIFSPGKFDSTSGSQFPGLVDSLFGIEKDKNQEKRWSEVRRQYSILLYHLGSAASTLRDYAPFKGASNFV